MIFQKKKLQTKMMNSFFLIVYDLLCFIISENQLMSVFYDSEMSFNQAIYNHIKLTKKLL
ncbi:MAG: hypothetical protein CMP79_01745 [Formosa sp.]|nr:hypothetical protein [Formosa sp.]